MEEERPEIQRERARLSTPAEEPPARNRLWRPGPWRKRRNWLAIIALLAAAAFLIVRFLAGGEKTEEAAAEPVVSVRVAKAERGPISAEVSALGTIFPREAATVSSSINAQIKRMPLLKNRQVRAGEVIAELEARDIQAQRAEAAATLEEAQAGARLLSGGTIPETSAQDEKAMRDARATLANARATYERRLALYERGGISKKDLEASQLSLTTAESDLRATETATRLHQTATNPNNRAMALSRVKQARDRLAALDAQLSFATIRAPFSGVITDQFQYEGEYASAGGKLLTLGDVSEVIVKAPFADTVAAQLKDGDPATVFPQDLPGEEFTGRISLVSRASDPLNRSVEVWISLKNEGARLRSNGAAKVVVSTATEPDAVAVPASAVTLEATNGDEGKVMVVDDEMVAHETSVKVGIRAADRMQIVSGLEGGETVVIEGNYALPDGSKVEINEGGEEETGGGDGAGGGSGPTPGNAPPNGDSQKDQGAGVNRGSGEIPAARPKGEPGARPGTGSQPGGKP
ncbi:MAG TPA: efflux RND transporter periplasmic adaptor subunit [Blastocatellia bacterium]|nr:efflux RND transporter periplasmic adaptor subunit [Blastocatellia bacterium]